MVKTLALAALMGLIIGFALVGYVELHKPHFTLHPEVKLNARPMRIAHHKTKAAETAKTTPAAADLRLASESTNQ